MNRITNIVVGGIGGQGVLRGTDILADAALRAGHDVKKSEIKGMSQRGGSVTGDVRFGERVFSPMVPAGEADFLLVLEASQAEPNRHMLRPDGELITPAALEGVALPHKRTLNVALLGALSARLKIAETIWLDALRAGFEPAFFDDNRNAFLLGRSRLETAQR